MNKPCRSTLIVDRQIHDNDQLRLKKYDDVNNYDLNRKKIISRNLDVNVKPNGIFGRRVDLVHCSSPSTSEPTWYASPSLGKLMVTDDSDRRLQKSDDDFGFRAAKIRVEARLKQRNHDTTVQPLGLLYEKPSRLT